MRDLLAVEYVSKGESKKEGVDALHFLDGCRGEVCKRSWISAKKSAEKGAPSPTIIARFPLAAPGSVIKLYPNWGFNDDDLEEQGLRIPISSLRAVAKTPISRFSGIRWSEGSDMTPAVFEKDNYIKIHSMGELWDCLKASSRSLRYCWGWCSESGEGENVFMQARVYGIDKIIASYAPSKFSGVAVQIFTRPIKETVERMRSDVYLLSNTEEYVNYIDGVEIKRNLVGKDNWLAALQAKYPKNHFKTAKEFLNKEDTSKKLEEDKLQAAMAAAMKSTGWATQTSSTTTLSFMTSTSSTGNY